VTLLERGAISGQMSSRPSSSSASGTSHGGGLHVSAGRHVTAAHGGRHTQRGGHRGPPRQQHSSSDVAGAGGRAHNGHWRGRSARHRSQAVAEGCEEPSSSCVWTDVSLDEVHKSDTTWQEEGAMRIHTHAHGAATLDEGQQQDVASVLRLRGAGRHCGQQDGHRSHGGGPSRRGRGGQQSRQRHQDRHPSTQGHQQVTRPSILKRT
jgi:hypothetical protein